MDKLRGQRGKNSGFDSEIKGTIVRREIEVEGVRVDQLTYR